MNQTLMENARISALRMTNQQIISSKCRTAKEVVSWMGAMQAQDYYMVKWAIGLRLPGSTELQIERAIDSGEILRTHVMRPTWHFVSTDDIHWMLQLTASQIKTSMKSRDKELGLTEQVYGKCNSIIEKAISQHGHLTREELILILEASKIKTNENRASHIFMRSELEGLICSGKPKNKKQTYALLSERAPNSKPLHRDDALTQLALRYFTSHGPATLPDFSWWSGLSVRNAQHALDSVQSLVVSETVNGHTYWMAQNVATVSAENSITVLPAFDEFLISYKDRTASLPPEINSKAVSNNGIFRPIIVLNGEVTGIWKRTMKAERALIEIEFFRPVKNTIKSEVEAAFSKYADFVNKKMEFKYTQ